MKLALLFPVHLREALNSLDEMEDLEEIRIRIGQPLFLYAGQKELFLVCLEGNFFLREKSGCGSEEKIYRTTEKDSREMLNYISNYSLYAYTEELKNGFITIKGGHRIGVAGTVVCADGEVKGMSHLTFLNIRVAHEKKECAKRILTYIKQGENICNTLIVSPPGAGKTTLLRDCIRSISYGVSGLNIKKIAIIDERSEIAACYQGVPQNDIGPRTDVLDGCNKAEGIMMLLRTMSPQIIAVDELGGEADFQAIERAAYCGCKIIGTIHAGSIVELKEKEIFNRWNRIELFERYVMIDRRTDGTRQFEVYNQSWECLC